MPHPEKPRASSYFAAPKASRVAANPGDCSPSRCQQPRAVPAAARSPQTSGQGATGQGAREGLTLSTCAVANSASPIDISHPVFPQRADFFGNEAYRLRGAHQSVEATTRTEPVSLQGSLR